MEQVFKFLEAHPYFTYMIAVVLGTAAVRNTFFNSITMGPKWITLIVATVLAVVLFTMKWINLETMEEFLILFSAFGAAIAFYDYFIKVIWDLIRKRNPFTEKPLKK